MDENMNNYFDEYDEDNVDLEKEMFVKDIEEEEAAEEAAAEALENKKATELSKKLNLRNITIDLEKMELHRQTYTFKKDGIVYKGIVIGKLNKDRYVFNVTYPGCNIPKLKAFNLSEIMQTK